MKNLIFAIAFITIQMTASLAFATPITKDAANAYYENCNAQPGQGLSNQSKEYLCACTAAKMMENMTVEDVKAMAAQNEQGRKAMNYMLVKVYAPCMNYPAKDHYYNTCIANPKTKILGGNPQAICTCMSDKIANYLANDGQKIFSDILRRNPNITDPMHALTSDKHFESFAQSKLIGCINAH